MIYLYKSKLVVTAPNQPSIDRVNCVMLNSIEISFRARRPIMQSHQSGLQFIRSDGIWVGLCSKNWWFWGFDRWLLIAIGSRFAFLLYLLRPFHSRANAHLCPSGFLRLRRRLVTSYQWYCCAVQEEPHYILSEHVGEDFFKNLT